MKKTVLITGAAGFVGRNFERHLALTQGWDIDAIDLKTNYDAHDVFSRSTKVYDLVIHAAAQAPHRAGIDHINTSFPYNVQLDSAMWHWAVRTNQRHVLYLSSSAIYPTEMQERESVLRLHESDQDVMSKTIRSPHDVYGWTKWMGERTAEHLRDCGVKISIVRPFSGYGTDQSLDFPFSSFIHRARLRDDPFPIWGSAEQMRDWIHIDDVVAQSLAVVDLNEEGAKLGAVNLCTGYATSMGKLVRMITREFGYEPEILVDAHAPLGVMYRVGEPELIRHICPARISLANGIRRAVEGRL